MEYVLASAPHWYISEIVRLWYKWILISYLNRSWFKNILPLLDKSHHFIVDSWAFSSWTLWKPVDIDKYWEFCVELKKQYTHINFYFVSLDIIPWSPWQKPTIEMINESWKGSLKQWLYMRDKYKIDFMPVFHHHEDLAILEEYIKHWAKYIGISPANDLPTSKRLEWLRYVFTNSSLIKNKIKTHWFGATAFPIIENIPFYTADSMSWKSSVLYNSYWVNIWGKMKRVRAADFRERFWLDPAKMSVDEKVVYNLEQLKPYLDRLKKLHKIKKMDYRNY